MSTNLSKSSSPVPDQDVNKVLETDHVFPIATKEEQYADIIKRLLDETNKFRRGIIMSRRQSQIRWLERQELLRNYLIQRLVWWHPDYTGVVPLIESFLSELFDEIKRSTIAAADSLENHPSPAQTVSNDDEQTASSSTSSYSSSITTENGIAENVVIDSTPANRAEALQHKEELFKFSLLNEISDYEWIANFRLDSSLFQWLCQIIGHGMADGDEMEQQKQIAISLYFLANGGKIESVCSFFGVSSSYVEKSLSKFLTIFLSELKECLILMPKDEAEYRDIRNGFKKRCLVPAVVVGAVNACQLPFIDIKNFAAGSAEKNLKLEIIVDEELLIRTVNLFTHPIAPLPQIPQAVHALSPEFIVDRNVPCFLVGSSEIYGVCSWLMCPYPDSDDPHKFTFNQACKNVLQFSDRCLARLLGRWKILHSQLHMDITILKSIVETCCALHNLAEELEQPYFREWDKDWDTNNFCVKPLKQTPNTGETSTEAALEMRDFLARVMTESPTAVFG